MALFNKESKEDKKEQKLQEFISRYGLENIQDPVTNSILMNVQATLSANKYADIGAALSGTATDMAKQTYLRALVEQNFIIIRQLDQLLNK